MSAPVDTPSGKRLAGHPEWAREVDARLPVNRHIVLTGNVHDVHIVTNSDRRPVLTSTQEVLRDCFVASGFQAVVHWHPVTGGKTLYEDSAGTVAEVLGEWVNADARSAAGLEDILVQVVRASRRIALLIEDAHRLVPDRNDLAVHRLFVRAAHLARTTQRRVLDSDTRFDLFNTVVWLVDREADLPHWLISADSVRVISVPIPAVGVRERAAATLLPALPGYGGLDETGRKAAAENMAGATEGMSLAELREVIPLALDRGITVIEPQDAVRFYRSGLQVSPWTEPAVVNRILNATTSLNDAVLGQERAVRTMVDILSRAALGLSGAQSDGHPGRPQGVVFLAGPTGVGKTELAKQVARLVFGREEAMVRFDMSEFAAEHNEARLLGAPPGFVGHEAGGELTNAVRQNPFRLLLFDEIEKAHDRILDKFLQILEDGRLTDGSGSTVLFSETLVVFTSNLGIYELDEHKRRVPVVLPGTEYPVLEDKVRKAIRDTFTKDIGRPELLNRIGDNIVVFDFIKEEVAAKLLRRALDTVVRNIERRTGARIELTDTVLDQLDTVVAEPERLAFGGRAVGSVVESRVVNPLARELLKRGPVGHYRVKRCWEDATGYHLNLEPVV